MDARTQKRMASVQHIKQKPYYRPLSEEPDPTATCSSRLWKWKMKVWVETLKEQAAPPKAAPEALQQELDALSLAATETSACSSE